MEQESQNEGDMPNKEYPNLTNDDVASLAYWAVQHKDKVHETLTRMRGDKKHFEFVRLLIQKGIFNEGFTDPTLEQFNNADKD